MYFHCFTLQGVQDILTEKSALSQPDEANSAIDLYQLLCCHAPKDEALEFQELLEFR